nr:Dam family site-specific DNA-(adenine-N6)-methyltransferase [Pseudomonas sp. DVZ6]
MGNRVTQEIVQPFLKWAGGKRWLVEKHLGCFPEKFNRYFEPFLGSGAVFFSLSPKQAFLSDLNPDLIEAYTAIRDDWALVYSTLKMHHRSHCKEYYYKVRASKPRLPHTRAAKFIYLNRTCWNGLYRVNLNGDFNVPIGTKKNVILDTDDFSSVSKLLNTANIKYCDFEETIDQAGAGDLIFADPPYTVKHNMNGFVKYNEKIFSWQDQERLSAALLRASERGSHIVSTNAYHPAVMELYNSFDLLSLDRTSVIAASSDRRGKYAELFITNHNHFQTTSE